MKIDWQKGNPDEACFCFVDDGDKIELAWYSIVFHGGCWFRIVPGSFIFEGFIEDEDVVRWVKANEVIKYFRE